LGNKEETVLQQSDAKSVKSRGSRQSKKSGRTTRKSDTKKIKNMGIGGLRTNAVLRNFWSKFDYDSSLTFEYKIVLKSLIEVIYPKFESKEITLLNKILSNIFSSVTLEEMDQKTLNNAISQVVKKKCLETDQSLVLKIQQIVDVINIRHGIFIVGNPFTGKSTLLDILATAINDIRDLEINELVLE